MTKLSNFITKVEETIIVILMAILSIVMVVAVMYRYFLSNPITWATEVSIYLFIWLSFIGGSWGLKYGLQAAVTFLQDALSGKKKCILKIIQDLIVFTFLLLVLFYATKWILSPSVMLQKSTSLGIPMWIPYSAVPVGMFFAAIHILARLVNVIKNELQTEISEPEEDII